MISLLMGSSKEDKKISAIGAKLVATRVDRKNNVRPVLPSIGVPSMLEASAKL